MYPCDLHTHTCRSDGNDTYQELIQLAAQRGVNVLAITDHDVRCAETVTADGKEVPLEVYGRSLGVRVLRGIEFSCDTVVEDVHIVALGCNQAHPFFEREHAHSVQSKLEGYQALCRLLTEDGMPLDWRKDVLLDGKRDETSVQRKMLFEAMAAKGYAPSWSDAKLMVKHSQRYAVKRIKPDPGKIIAGIHESGGIAILAHPYLMTAGCDDEDAFRTRYIEGLIEAGLDGIEACYPYHKTSYDGPLSDEEMERRVREAYQGRLSVISGGSDYHNERKKGVQNPRELGEKGLTLEAFMAQKPLAKLLEHE